MMTMTLHQQQLTPSQMNANLAPFISKINTLCDLLGLDLTCYQADHIALRINDSSLARQAHEAWASQGQVISQAVINGRPIIVMKFDSPLSADSWSIECLELPYPATGKIYPQQGWEHIEFVVPSKAQSVDDYLQEILTLFPVLAERWAQLEELNVKVKLSSPQGEGERLANPTIAFKHQGVCIKLHPYALSEIVASEQS